jgi:hypothetical protein
MLKKFIDHVAKKLTGAVTAAMAPHPFMPAFEALGEEEFRALCRKRLQEASSDIKPIQRILAVGMPEDYSYRCQGTRYEDNYDMTRLLNGLMRLHVPIHPDFEIIPIDFSRGNNFFDLTPQEAACDMVALMYIQGSKLATDKYDNPHLKEFDLDSAFSWADRRGDLYKWQESVAACNARLVASVGWNQELHAAQLVGKDKFKVVQGTCAYSRDDYLHDRPISLAAQHHFWTQVQAVAQRFHPTEPHGISTASP